MLEADKENIRSVEEIEDLETALKGFDSATDRLRELGSSKGKISQRSIKHY